ERAAEESGREEGRQSSDAERAIRSRARHEHLPCDPAGSTPPAGALRLRVTGGAGLRRRRGGGRAPATEEAEEPAPPGAADERAGLLVERRVVHQLPERALAAIELGRDLREVGDGAIEVAEQTSRIRLV